MISDNIVTEQILTPLIKKIMTTVELSQFAKKNANAYATKVHQSTLNDIVAQMLTVPHKSIHQNERQSAALRLDSLMSVKEVIYTKISQKRNKNGAHRHFKTFHRHNNTGVEVESNLGRHRIRTNKTKFTQLDLRDSKKVEDLEQNAYIERLRLNKQKQQRQRLLRQQMLKNRSIVSLKKGQTVVFDYDGSIQSGVDSKITNFNEKHLRHLTTSVNKSFDKLSKPDAHNGIQKKSVTVMPKLQRSARNRTQSKSQIQFVDKRQRQRWINQIKLSNQRTTLIMNGHRITQLDTEAQGQKQSKSAQALHHKYLSQYLNQRRMLKKTSQFEQFSNSIPLKPKRIQKTPSKKKDSIAQFNRQGIRIQNQALRRQLTQIDDIHYEIPRNKPIRPINLHQRSHEGHLQLYSARQNESLVDARQQKIQ